MEIRLKRNEFLAELLPMQGIVERRTTIPVLSHLLLTVSGDRLHLAATDLDVSLTSWVTGEVLSEGAIAVQAKKFIEIVRSAPGEEIRLAREDDRSLAINAGTARFRIHGLPASDFPTLTTVDPRAEVELPLARFRRLVGKVLFAVSSEESRFQLSGALLRLKPGAVELVATDGHRLALIEAPVAASKAEDQVLVPRKALQEILRFEGEELLRFRRGEHHLVFSAGRRDLTCRILEGSFPDYERVIGRQNDKRVVVDRRTLSDAVRRVALITGERARGVRLEFAPGELTVVAANPDLGEASETVASELTGEALKLGLNPDYLAQFLDAIETEKVLFELKDENSQCLGSPLGGEDERYLCVIMPMRI